MTPPGDDVERVVRAILSQFANRGEEATQPLEDIARCAVKSHQAWFESAERSSASEKQARRRVRELEDQVAALSRPAPATESRLHRQHEYHPDWVAGEGIRHHCENCVERQESRPAPAQAGSCGCAAAIEQIIVNGTLRLGWINPGWIRHITTELKQRAAPSPREASSGTAKEDHICREQVWPTCPSCDGVEAHDESRVSQGCEVFERVWVMGLTPDERSAPPATERGAEERAMSVALGCSHGRWIGEAQFAACVPCIAAALRGASSTPPDASRGES